MASTDYSGELSISDEILKRVVEGYRRIRNTLRFLLANLTDYDHAKHALPPSEWLEIDRYAVALTAQLQKEVLSHYDVYEFHPVVAKLQTFCSEDLGGFYLDVLKDRLYTTAPDSRARRAAQNALYHITQSMLHWMAPFLPFTAEEAWQVFRHGTGHDETIFTSTYYATPALDHADGLLEKWHEIRTVRAEVTSSSSRCAWRAVSASPQAEVSISAGGPTPAALQSPDDDLRFVLLTSAATVTPAPEGGDLLVTVTPSTHAKCERCWHYREDVGADTAHPHCAAVASATCSAPANNGATPDGRRGHARGAFEQAPEQAAGTTPWLWMAFALLVVMADQFLAGHRAQLRLRRIAPGDRLLQPGTGLQQGRGLQLPGRRRRLAALVLHRPGRRGRPVHHLAAVPPHRPAAVLPAVSLILGGAVATWWTACSTAMWSTSSTSTQAATTGPPSTSPTAPSPSARRC